MQESSYPRRRGERWKQRQKNSGKNLAEVLIANRQHDHVVYVTAQTFIDQPEYVVMTC